jgi:hypothetical protein
MRKRVTIVVASIAALVALALGGAAIADARQETTGPS